MPGAIGITRQLPVKEPDITLLFLFRTLFGDIRCYQAATTYPQTYGELSQILKDTGFHNCMQLQSKVRNKKRDQQKLISLAPPVGLEPTTCGLTVRRSTD